MFSWICPHCGHDVPPSKTDCPFCADREKEAAAIAAAGPPPPQPNQQQAPPPQYAAQYPPPPHYAPPQYAPQNYPAHQHPQGAWPPPEAKHGLPTWLMTLGVALALLLVGGGIWYAMQRSGGGSNSAEKAGLENPANPSRQKVSNPLQKYVEVVGLRLINENKRPVAKFVVVNHSATEIGDLAANVTLWASTSRSEEDSVGSFSFKLPSIGANSSKDLTAPLKTKFKMYELPDWQNTTAEIEITSSAP
ncbi:MAG: hypothetical protein M3N93_03540 [Acidobacteriota bacterium]|nr:hypothetical protein [Acidobacteriota bacterium]